MSDRAEDLRREAARCLAQADATVDTRRREELTTLAARFHDLADSAEADLDTILQAINDAQMIQSDTSKPVVQQQRQVKSKTDRGSGK